MTAPLPGGTATGTLPGTAPPAPGSGPAGQHPAGRALAGRVARRARALWRRWRGLLVIGAVIVLGAIVIGVLRPPAGNQYLSPGSVSADGTHALADVLAELGRQVIPVTSVTAAEKQASAGTTLVITSPGYLSASQLAGLAKVPADILLVEPNTRALQAVAPGVRIAGTGLPVLVTAPGCTLGGAELAGIADMGGTVMKLTRPAGAQRCYLIASEPSLVQVRSRGHLVTVLGTSAPLTNAGLASQGNAALAINLLPGRRIIWLVPPAVVVPVSGKPGPKSFASLVPLAAYLVAIQLAAALLLAAAWRARRLGPLVTEPLPIVVRASETIEGHGRLYQSRHARARAAEILRAALIRRVGPAIGLPAGAGREAVVAALARRSARDQEQISELLYGQPPGSDQALAGLAGELDELEREVGTT